jgi:hypothetical protein
MKNIIVVLTFLSLIASCVQDGGGSAAKKSGSEDNLDGPTTNPTVPTGPGSTTTSETTDDLLNSIKVDLRHIIDPYDGSYKTKVTIPQNYEGKLYISGLNINSLKSQFVYVRFRFGADKTEKIIQATPSTGTGITPQTDVDVLILDMKDKPFDDLRLSYKLFDYNNYDSDADGFEFGVNDDPKLPTDDIKNSGLYCRGLNLEDDPTFTITTTNNECDSAGETCLYTYANIEDSGFVQNSSGNYITPTKPQVNSTADTYSAQTQTELLKHCLPDVNYRPIMETALGTTFSSSSAVTTAYGDTAFGGTYTYHGPYRQLNAGNWQIKGDAIFSPVNVPGALPTGIFQYVLPNTPAASLADGGLKSFLFPRAGKASYSSGTEYIGFTDLTSPLSSDRAIRTLLSGGETEYVDGCNVRKRESDISNCNISATVELVTRDTQTGSWVSLTKSNKIKLQISRASQTDQLGNEVYFSAFKMCDNSNSCGSNECCYNERCWSKDLVSQCKEDTNSLGNLLNGETCNTDTQCASLCCSDSSQTCSPHDPNGNKTCDKNPGAACITKEFCQEQQVETCQIIKTSGNSCTLFCHMVPVHGDCLNGTCQAPETPARPTFDPDNPDCSLAVAPPTF